jgi:hypothetical protein
VVCPGEELDDDVVLLFLESFGFFSGGGADAPSDFHSSGCLGVLFLSASSVPVAHGRFKIV